jgi:catechol 2,3-dioxygenase-like lactoylglutathione lyase family enzyme
MTTPTTADGPALLHVTIVPSELATSLAFYDAALAALGIERHSDFPDEEESDAPVDAVAYAAPRAEPMLWVVAGAESSRGLHVALQAESRVAVERFWAAATAAGGTGRQAPREWEIYRRGYFGAIVADPDGNLIEAVVSE